MVNVEGQTTRRMDGNLHAFIAHAKAGVTKQNFWKTNLHYCIDISVTGY